MASPRDIMDRLRSIERLRELLAAEVESLEGDVIGLNANHAKLLSFLAYLYWREPDVNVAWIADRLQTNASAVRSLLPRLAARCCVCGRPIDVQSREKSKAPCPPCAQEKRDVELAAHHEKARDNRPLQNYWFMAPLDAISDETCKCGERAICNVEYTWSPNPTGGERLCLRHAAQFASTTMYMGGYSPKYLLAELERKYGA